MKIINEKNWIDWIQLFLISLMAPFFLFPSMEYIWISLIIPIIWICRWMVKRQLIEKTILDCAIAILMIQVLVTCIIVPNLEFSLPKIAGILLGVFVFYSTVALLKSDSLIKIGIFFFLASGFFLSLVSILDMRYTKEKFLNQIFSIDKMISKLDKFIPQMQWKLPGAERGINPNAIGGTLILVIPLSLILVLSYFKRRKENSLIFSNPIALIFLTIILFVMCIVLFSTLSVSSWIGLIVSTWILIFSWKWKKWSLGIILLSVLYIFLIKPANATLIINTVKKDILKKEVRWLAGINTVSRHPLFGIGMNRIRLIPSVGYERSHAHNHILHTGAELGIPGSIAYLAILIGIGYMCFEIWRKSNIRWTRMTAIGLGCGQLAHFIFGMADSIPLGAKPGIFFWFSLALITSMYNHMMNQGQRS